MTAQNPPRQSLVPRWNLSVVLAALNEKPFEHLCQALPHREHDIVSATLHSIQGVATSWAEIARVPASEICRVVTWSGPCTFGQFYWLDFSGGGFWGCRS